MKLIGLPKGNGTRVLRAGGRRRVLRVPPAGGGSGYAAAVSETTPRSPRSRQSAAGPALWRWGEDPWRLDEHWGRGGVVAIPTESSYGLAVDPRDPGAVAAVLRIKGRPEGQALPVVGGAVADLERLGLRLDLAVLAPVVAAWPAALTVVVPCAAGLPAACGLPSLAVRIPAHPALAGLLRSLERAVTATSANRSGEAPATRVEEVLELLRGEPAIVIDDGVLPGGPPSTIVEIRGGRLVVSRSGRHPVGSWIGD